MNYKKGDILQGSDCRLEVVEVLGQLLFTRTRFDDGSMSPIEMNDSEDLETFGFIKL